LSPWIYFKHPAALKFGEEQIPVPKFLRFTLNACKEGGRPFAEKFHHHGIVSRMKAENFTLSIPSPLRVVVEYVDPPVSNSGRIVLSNQWPRHMPLNLPRCWIKNKDEIKMKQ